VMEELLVSKLVMSVCPNSEIEGTYWALTSTTDWPHAEGRISSVRSVVKTNWQKNFNRGF
jgi:hypothetical protein